MKITATCTCGAKLHLEGPTEACVKVSQMFLKEHERCGKQGPVYVQCGPICPGKESRNPVWPEWEITFSDEIWPPKWYLSGGTNG